MPDPEWGRSGCAWIVPTHARLAFDAEALLAWARQRLAGYKLPRRIVLVDALPRTASGKVQKQRLQVPDAP